MDKRGGKKQHRHKKPSPKGPMDDGNIMNMLNQVNQMLTTNPEMLKKIGECVNNIFENKELMSTLVNEIQSNVQKDSDCDSESEIPTTSDNNQTLLIKDSTDSVDALE